MWSWLNKRDCEGYFSLSFMLEHLAAVNCWLSLYAKYKQLLMY
ncbi:hypothetical protein AALB_1885 [Agarivorans albus MKT 106]|uniref:Uncharacterized protein n=1 Tax=Agarivorans albus MKT 106 TaxID=1331007 RepID=R9PKD8_AGAAL|nr:hypothetical protein AALB_1885 [Agarivorans albus MKT 106]